MKRCLLISVAAMLALFGWSLPASAGGWALAELAAPPGEVSAGVATEIDVLILHHGVTPLSGSLPTLTAMHRETRTSISVDGDEVSDDPGTYRFAVRFPVAGEWKWHVTHDPLPGSTSFPTLTVVAGESDIAAGTPATKSGTTIAIANLAFSPATLEVQAGTTVTWVNADPIPHQVSSAAFLWFDDSPMLQPGDSYSFTFEVVGTFDYICGPHPGMAGSIVVV